MNRYDVKKAYDKMLQENIQSLEIKDNNQTLNSKIVKENDDTNWQGKNELTDILKKLDSFVTKNTSASTAYRISDFIRNIKRTIESDKVYSRNKNNLGALDGTDSLKKI